MSNEKKTWRQTAGILLSVCALGMACCSLFLCFSSDIWYDELFTVGFVSQPVGRMISLAARDGILKEWQKRGIKSVETADSCLLERYWFNIYRLGLQP